MKPTKMRDLLRFLQIRLPMEEARIGWMRLLNPQLLKSIMLTFQKGRIYLTIIFRELFIRKTVSLKIRDMIVPVFVLMEMLQSCRN